MIPHNQKKRLYKTPDFAMIVSETALTILLRDLESLLKMGGAYYEVFPMELEKGKLVVVLFLDDSLLDVLAEITRLKTRMDELDCRVDFKSYARHDFERFSGREVQGLLNDHLEREVDLDTLTKSKVVLDKLYLHDKRK
jgi:hypothetical protein